MNRLIKRLSGILLASAVLAGAAAPFALSPRAEDTSDKIDVFVPNICTYNEDGQIEAVTLDGNAKKNVVSTDNADVYQVLDGGWSGTKDHWANPNSLKAYMFSASDNTKAGTVIFKIAAPEGKVYDTLNLTFNARDGAGTGGAVLSIGKTADGTFTQLITGADSKGCDTDIDATKQARGWSEAYLKVVFPPAMYKDFCALWSITAEATYMEPTAETAGDKIDVFVPNICTYNEDGQIEAVTLDGNAKKNVVSTDNAGVYQVLDGGWSGTKDHWANPNSLKAYMFSATDCGKVGSVVFRIAAPADKFYDTLNLTVNARDGAGGTGAILYISNAADTGFVQIISGSASKGVDTDVDVTKQVKGWNEVYIKAEFPTAAFRDFNALWSITAEATYTDDASQPGSLQTLLNVNYGDENYEKDWPSYETVNMKRDFIDYYYGLMNIPTDSSVGPACKDGWVTYHFTNVRAGYLKAYITHRACMNVPVIVEYSDSGDKFETVDTLSTGHLETPAEVDLSEFALGATDFYLRFRVPGNMCYDWGTIRSIRVVNEVANIERDILMDVDYSKDNWASQQPTEAQKNLRWGFTDDGYGIMPQQKNDSGPACDEAYVTYKFTGVNAQKVMLFSKNRSCMDVSVLYEYSLDGENYTTMLDQRTTHKNESFELDITKFVKNIDTFYVRVRIPGNTCYDWGCLYALKIVAMRGDIRLFYEVETVSNEGGKLDAPKQVLQGEPLTVKAVPDAGYSFVGWFAMDGALLSRDAAYTVTPEGDIRLNAKFRKTYDGDVVLYADFNDEKLSFLDQAADSANLSVAEDAYQKNLKKYGVSLVKQEPMRDGYLTYRFEKNADMRTFKAVLFGRGVQETSMTFQYSRDGKTWTDVKSLGGGRIYAWNFSEKEINFTDYLTDGTFYVRVLLHKGGLAPWLTMSRLVFIRNGEVKPNDYDAVHYDEGGFGHLLAEKAAAPAADITFNADNFVAHTWYNRNLQAGKDGLSFITSSDTADVVWKLESTVGISALNVALKGRTDGTVYLRYSTDGVTWKKLAYQSGDMKQNFTVDAKNSSDIVGAKQVYIRALCNGSTTITGLTVSTAPIGSTWVKTADGYRYLEENGAYAVGMTRIGDNTYFFDENGIMQSGWLCRDGKWYCFGEDGAMKRSCRLERAGRSGYAGEDGALLTGYQKREDGVWFFGRESGLTLPEGLLLDGEARYWVGENGQLVTDSWKAYHKRLYYFDETGLLTRSVLAELDTVTGLAAEKTEGGFTLSWTAVKGAVSYEIVNADTGEVLGRTEATTFAVSLGEGTLSVKVRAIGEKSEGAFSEAILLKVDETPASSEEESSVVSEEESSAASSAPESDTPASSDSGSSAPAPVDTGVRSGLVGWLALLFGSLAVAVGALFTAKKHKAKEQ